MKDAVLTLRISSDLRGRLERRAREQGRSLSQAAGLLIEQGLAGEAGRVANRERGTRPLAGSLPGGAVPTLEDFRDVRAFLTRALDARTRSRDVPRR